MKAETTSVQVLLSREAARKGDGAFGFAAMMRAGAYDPADAEMCASKFEALGNEIERLRGLLWAILAADERGQGVNYSEAMNAAAKAINYVS